VNQSIQWICDYLDVSPELVYGGGDRGWIGDNPFIFLDTTKVRNLGWQPKLSIAEGVQKTIAYLHQNPWVLEAR
jgi:UDP-glucose 4-epimerase